MKTKAKSTKQIEQWNVSIAGGKKKGCLIDS